MPAPRKPPESGPIVLEGDLTECPAGKFPLVASTTCTGFGQSKPLIRLGDYSKCGWNYNVVLTAALDFILCGLPVARLGDLTSHGGVIVSGNGTMTAHGGTFALPDNITLEGGEGIGPPGQRDFMSAAIRDLYFLWNTRTGRALIEGIGKSGRPWRIRQSTSAHQGEARPYNSGASGGIIEYNPGAAVWIYTRDANGNLRAVPQPPQVLLGHELVHALHDSWGTNPGRDKEDEKKPSTDPVHTPIDEAQAMGLFTYGKGADWKDVPLRKEEEAMRKALGLPLDPSFPTENSLREDLKLDPRANYDYTGIDPSTGVEAFTPKVDLRPGACDGCR